MLQAIRERAQGIFAWIMLIVIGVPFALWGIQNYIDTGKEIPAAVVDGHEIFDRDVSKAYEQSLMNLSGSADYDEKQLKHDALERLIDQQVLSQDAGDKRFAVSDHAVRDYVQAQPYFQTDGRFDKEKYKSLLVSQGMDSARFVEQVRSSLLMEQYQNGIAKTAFSTPRQLETLLRLKSQEREVTYAALPLTPVKRSMSDAEIQTYYNDHAADFRNEEAVSVDYILLSLEDLAAGVQVSEDELHKLYDEQKGHFGAPERRKLSHILIQVEGSGPEADQLALSKAQSVKDKLGKGEDFAKLAAEMSADMASARKGGDLGYFNTDAQEESFKTAALSLKPGEISNPVKTSFGYHLIKLTELTPSKAKPFAEVRDELLRTAQHNTAESRFYEMGQKLSEQAFEHPDSLEPAATQLGAKVQQSGLLTRSKGEGVAQNEAVRKAAFDEDVINGRNSDPVELGNDKAMVLRVRDHVAASDKPLAEVRNAIVARLEEQAARADAGQRAQALLGQMQGGKSIDDAAKASGIKSVNMGFIRRESETGLAPELKRAIFKAARPVQGKPTVGDVTLPNGGHIVYSVSAIKDGSTQLADAKDRASAEEFLVQSDAQRELIAFVERLRERAKVKLKSVE